MVLYSKQPEGIRFLIGIVKSNTMLEGKGHFVYVHESANNFKSLRTMRVLYLFTSL